MDKYDRLLELNTAIKKATDLRNNFDKMYVRSDTHIDFDKDIRNISEALDKLHYDLVDYINIKLVDAWKTIPHHGEHNGYYQFWVESDLDDKLEDDEKWKIETINKLKDVLVVFGIVTGYIVTSDIRVKFPTLIKYRKDARFTFGFTEYNNELIITIITRNMTDDGEVISQQDLYTATIYVNKKNEDE
ncbi:MAG TPA: hypothetical protein DCW90_24905 [Lachnospiraceae bacterium]|nr:hypothetical protein [Lachnospiraceae bacterium]